MHIRLSQCVHEGVRENNKGVTVIVGISMCVLYLPLTKYHLFELSNKCISFANLYLPNKYVQTLPIRVGE